MYSSAPQACHYYGNSSIGKDDASVSRYHSDPSNHSSNSSGGFQGTSDTTPTTPASWQHMDHDYSPSSPTPTATSPSFPIGNTSTSSTLSTPYVLSHSSGSGHQSDKSSSSSSSSSNSNHPGFLGTPAISPPPPPLLPSYGYGLSHRGFFPRPKLTTTLWEDERTICFQVDANGICVARREDNDMINGTKLLNVAGMSRGKRDGILKNEKGRVVVKVGAMHLKGVWITFDRAKTLSAQFKIQDALYPLFVDNPQTFLYSHPITNPISHLGSFRSFYPSSWDRSTVTSPSHQYTMEAPSNPRHEMVAPFGYRPVTSPDDLPPPATVHSSNYGDGNHDNGESIDYRPNGPPSDTLTDHHLPHRPHYQRHHPSVDNSQPHDSSYYNNLLDSNPHRVNDMSFYNTTNRDTDKLMVSHVSSPESTNGDYQSSSFLMNGSKRAVSNAVGGSGGLQQPVSTSQSIDSTTLYHPQPLGMDSTNASDRDPYNSHQHHLANPLPARSSHNNNSNILLSGHIDSTTDNPLTPSSSTTTSSPPSPSSFALPRRDSLVMMNHRYPRNGPPQRHHPYANLLTPPKLSSMHDYAQHSRLPLDSASTMDTSPAILRKPSFTSRLQSGVPPSRPLAEELGDLSVKTESDHLSRPW